MQLISFLKRENNVKFPKFKYLIEQKFYPSHPPGGLEARSA